MKRTTTRPFLLLASLASSFTATTALSSPPSGQEEFESGYLEASWGDPEIEDSTLPAVLDVSLVQMDGRRIRLDANTVNAATDDIGALNGRLVAVAFRDALPAAARAVDALAPLQEIERRTPVNRSWAILGCRFPEDNHALVPTAEMRQLYGPSRWRLGDYWNRVSWGQASLRGAADFGWTTLPGPKYSYEDPDARHGYNLSRIAQSCLDASGLTAELQPFDGLSLALSSSLTTDGSSGYAFGGQSCLRVHAETVCRPTMWLPPWSQLKLSTIAHEMGHGYGLSHVDNSDGDTDPYDNPWDLMSSSGRHAVVRPFLGTQPKFLSMDSRLKLGWVPEDSQAFVQLPLSRFDLPTEVHLQYANANSASGTRVLVVRMPIPHDRDGNPVPEQAALYIIEARSTASLFDQRLPGDAVIIHRKPSAATTGRLVDADHPPANFSNTEGVMFRPGETYEFPQQAGKLRIISQTEAGFRVSVTRN